MRGAAGAGGACSGAVRRVQAVYDDDDDWCDDHVAADDGATHYNAVGNRDCQERNQHDGVFVVPLFLGKREHSDPASLCRADIAGSHFACQSEL